MSLLGTGGIYTDGIQFVKKQMRIKDPKGETLQERFADAQLNIYAPANGNVPPFMLLYLDNTDMYLIHKEEEYYNENDLYTVSGNTIPDSEVFISHFTDELTISNLVKNKLIFQGQVVSAIASQPTEDADGGDYAFEGISGLKAPFYVWTKCDPKYAAIARLSCLVTPGFSSIDIKGYFINKVILAQKHYCSQCDATGARLENGNRHYCRFCNGTGVPKLDRLQLTIAGLCTKDEDENGNSIQASEMPTEWICQRCQGTGKISTNTYNTCPKCKGEKQFSVIFTYNDESTNTKTQGCAYCGGHGDTPGSGQIEIYETCPDCGGDGTLNIPSELTYDQLQQVATITNRVAFDTPGDPFFDENDEVYRNFSIHIQRADDNVTKPYLIWQYTPSPIDGGIINIKETKIANETESEPSAPPCLGKGTLITMADGTLKPIENIKSGDLVLDADHNSHPVKYLSRNRFAKYHTLYYFDDGTIIDEVNKHRFYNIEQGFYQLMKFWKIGEHGLTSDGKKIKLVDKKRIDEKAEAFGLYTKNGNYYANNLLSGQAFVNKKYLSEMDTKKAINMLLSIDNEANLFKLFEEKGALV